VRILNGTLPPGERIRQEELADDFGASRLPVRDALRRLEADGLVTIVANTGAWVSKLTEAECADAYQIRERLEPLLLEQGMLKLDEEEIKELEELASNMEQAEDVESFLRLDREFHLLTYSEAPAGMVRDLVERLWNTTQHYRRAFAQINGIDKSSVTHMEHRLIIDSIKRKDIEEAQRVLAGHIRRTRTSLIDHPELFS
jgi:DNA-binding GntR family transcriptional regulator